MKPDLSRAQWRKSSYSGNTGNCVEVAMTDNYISVRNSKEPDSKVLSFTSVEWNAFIHKISSDEFKF